MSSRPRVAIVGAGLAGLSAARALGTAGIESVLLDKGRGAGGRSSTRRAGELRFDHGAQYFTVKDPSFRVVVERWLERGAIAPWTGRIGDLTAGGEFSEREPYERFVGIPGMSACVRALSQGLDVRFGDRVERIGRRGGSWEIRGSDGEVLASAERLVLAIPPEQTVELLETSEPALAAHPITLGLGPVRSSPCWAALVSFEDALGLDFDGAFVRGSGIDWIARNSSKPERPAGEHWVLHASADWSYAHLEEERERAAELLLADFFDAVGLDARPSQFLTAHRWRYARVAEPLTVGALWDRELGLGVCGDWCHGCRIEGAYLSGLAMAERLLDR